jgi:DNA-binding NtrC family response regulator
MGLIEGKKMRNIKLLLVDDEQRFLSTAEKILRRQGFDVLTTESGQDALSQLKEHDVQVVILDVKMPGMDGIQTLKEIKRLYPHLEVIMLTGHATVPSAVEAMQMGASDYLMKPVAMDLLITKTCEAVDRGRKTKQE